ncbi:UNVERIFIED_CONTAM: hypothetical protein Sindi_2277100 [Sesamum indicum]
MLLLHERGVVDTMAHREAILMVVVVAVAVAVVVAVMIVASVKAKGKDVKTNLVEARISDNTHMDASNFFQSIENNDKNLPELPLQFGDISEDFDMFVD